MQITPSAEMSCNAGAVWQLLTDGHKCEEPPPVVGCAKSDKEVHHRREDDGLEDLHSASKKNTNRNDAQWNKPAWGEWQNVTDQSLLAMEPPATSNNNSSNVKSKNKTKLRERWHYWGMLTTPTKQVVLSCKYKMAGGAPLRIIRRAPEETEKRFCIFHADCRSKIHSVTFCGISKDFPT